MRKKKFHVKFFLCCKKKNFFVQMPGFEPMHLNMGGGNAYLIKRLDHRVTIVNPTAVYVCVDTHTLQ